MSHITPWVRNVLIIITLCVVIVLPLSLYVIRMPQVATFLPPIIRSRQTGPRYSVQSDMVGYKLSLADTRYLDYVAAHLNIFVPDAIADPRIYAGQPDIKDRKQISSVRFVLVDHVDHTVDIISEGNGQGAPVRIVAMGEYTVQNDVLEVRVAVQFAAIGNPLLVKKFAWEDAFLQCAVTTLYYALGDRDPAANQRELVRIKQDIEHDVYTGGIFPWPFRITEAKS